MLRAFAKSAGRAAPFTQPGSLIQPRAQRRFYRERMSRLYAPTLKAESGPSLDTSTPSYRLMVRAGFIRASSTGIYTLLPLGQKVLAHLESLVDRTMLHYAEAHKLTLPNLLPAKLWKRTGRWDTTGSELIRLQDRKGASYCLGPTHEEEITQLIGSEVTSLRQLPLRLYQVGRKFRDELRPRAGLLRAREFVMKDLYTFDADRRSALDTYLAMRLAYRQFFKAVGLPFIEARADGGNIGGDESHEFHYTSTAGEDTVLQCPNCHYAANTECAVGLVPSPTLAPLRDHLPAATQALASLIERSLKQGENNGLVDLSPADYTNFEKCGLSIHLGYLIPEDASSGPPSLGLIVLPAQRSLNSTSVKQNLAPNFTWLAHSPDLDSNTDSATKASANLSNGGAGPNASLTALVDSSLASMLGSQLNTIAQASNRIRLSIGPWVETRVGDGCAQCSTTTEGGGPEDIHPLGSFTTIEVGHTFYLGTKYSKALGAVIQSTPPSRKEPASTSKSASSPSTWQPIEMGCYGIGMSRLIAAAVDQCQDAKGIRWPVSIAPYRLSIMPILPKGGSISLPSTESNTPTDLIWKFTHRLYDILQSRAATGSFESNEDSLLRVEDGGLSDNVAGNDAHPLNDWMFWSGRVLIDDRVALSPGQRFKDAELIGFPWVVVVGKQYLLKQEVELHDRWTLTKRNIHVEQLLTLLDQLATQEHVHLADGK